MLYLSLKACNLARMHDNYIWKVSMNKIIIVLFSLFAVAGSQAMEQNATNYLMKQLQQSKPVEALQMLLIQDFNGKTKTQNASGLQFKSVRKNKAAYENNVIIKGKIPTNQLEDALQNGFAQLGKNAGEWVQIDAHTKAILKEHARFPAKVKADKTAPKEKDATLYPKIKSVTKLPFNDFQVYIQ